jgi:hypothetical protein
LLPAAPVRAGTGGRQSSVSMTPPRAVAIR